MKQGIIALAVCLFACVLLSGCATPYPYGAFYTEIKAPAGIAQGDLSYSKVGTSKSTSILGLVATGDGSIKTAASNGGINRVKYVEYSAKNILGLFGEYTTTVYGD